MAFARNAAIDVIRALNERTDMNVAGERLLRLYHPDVIAKSLVVLRALVEWRVRQDARNPVDDPLFRSFLVNVVQEGLRRDEDRALLTDMVIRQGSDLELEFLRQLSVKEGITPMEGLFAFEVMERHPEWAYDNRSQAFAIANKSRNDDLTDIVTSWIQPILALQLRQEDEWLVAELGLRERLAP